MIRSVVNRHLSVAALVIVALGLGACSSSTSGSPGPETAATTTQLGSSGPATSTENGDPLASTDPCSLLDASVISQNQLSQGKSGTGPGNRNCRWNSAPGASGAGYVIAISIYDHAGLDQLSTTGYSVENDSIGQHQGRISKGTSSGTCIVSLGVSSTSRVDVFADDSGGNLAASCAIATQAAPSVEQKLPAGTG